MKRKLWALGIGMVLACSPSFAWMALASDAYSNTSIYFGADTPEEATREAMKMCEAKHTGCKVGKPVNATAMVVAKGTGGWGSAADPTPEKAEATALEECRKRARNCKVRQAVWDPGVVWAALATGGNRSFLRLNADSKEQAEADALVGCRKDSNQPQACTISPVFTQSARMHYARAFNDNSTTVGYGVSHTTEKAKALALKGCAEQAQGDTRCTIDRLGLNESNKPEPKGIARLRALAERNAAAASAPPPAPRATVATTTSSNVLRCSNKCVNGSCVRTFDNGRKERWNAPRVFDPFTRNWEWDITTNACGM